MGIRLWSRNDNGNRSLLDNSILLILTRESVSPQPLSSC